MNVLLPTIGSLGDLHPMIGLGRTLQERGHQVTVVANPLHEESVREAGLHFEPLGTREQAEAILANPDLWHPRRGIQVIARGAILPAMRPLYEIIARQDPADTVIGAHSLAFGARLAQEKLGFPVATIHLQPSLIRSVYEMPVNGVALPAWLPRPLKRAWWLLVDRAVVDPLLAEGVNAFRAELGLALISRLFHEWMHSPRRVIGLFPEWLAAPQPDWPPQTRLTGFPLYDVGEGRPLPPGLLHFLEAGPPPIVFTFGSAMLHGRAIFQTAVEVAQRLGRRALLVARDRAQIPASLPATIHYEPYVPFGDLLPRAALLVHHGGIGTLAQALAAGIPQVVLPMSHDQPDNARRLERLGVGTSLAPREAQPASLARALQALLGSTEVQARCQRLAKRLDAQQARSEAAGWIEQLAPEVVTG